MIFERDLARIASYHDESPVAANAYVVDDRTWSDLDLDAVVATIDTTRCAVGQQMLHHLVRTPLVDRDALHAREREIQKIREHRAALTKELKKLARLDLYDVHRLFRQDLPERPRSLLLFPIVSVLSLIAAATAFVIPQAILAVLVLAIISFAIHLTYRRRIHELIQPVSVLKRLLDCASAIARITDDASLQRDAAALAPLRRSTRWLVLETLQVDNVTGLVYQYLNMFLLLDVNAFVFSLETIRTRRAELERLFAAVGMTDALLAVLAFRESTATSIPQFIESNKSATFETLVHPLIDEAVPNDLALNGKSVLVTGSNMSGKTTLLRAAGVNAILAQTIHTVTAARYAAPLVRVQTSIGKGDSVLEGRSYYLREVDDVRALVVSSESNAPHLFIVDELFRGTNTRERIAAGAAVLRYLNRGPHLTLASTHDLELIELLVGEYEFHHFRESIENGDLTFDFKLHDGPSSTRNAIAILAMRGFPESVIGEAMKTVERSRTVGQSHGRTEAL